MPTTEEKKLLNTLATARADGAEAAALTRIYTTETPGLHMVQNHTLENDATPKGGAQHPAGMPEF